MDRDNPQLILDRNDPPTNLSSTNRPHASFAGPARWLVLVTHIPVIYHLIPITSRGK